MTRQAEKLKTLLADAAQHSRVVLTGHDAPDVDSVISCMLLHALLTCWGIQASIVLPTAADPQATRVLARFDVDVTAFTGEIEAEDALVLVDHHQPLHAGRVVACVDHHPTAYPPAYPYVWIEPCGACALMVLRLWETAGETIPERALVLAVTALYLDTIALRSTKLTVQEARWGRAQAEALGLDIAWLEREGMGLRDMSLPAPVLAMTGKKAYTFAGRRVLSTYVQTNAMTADRLTPILDVLRDAVRAEEAALWVFLVHDPQAMRSVEYDVTPDGRVQVRHYDALVSRGKDVMPRVEREMREE